MRVVVADDSMLTREGIVRMLVEAGVDVVGQACDGRDLLAQVDASSPDVAIIDIKMPPTFTDEGLVAAASVRERYPEVGILVLSQYLETGYAMRLIETVPEGTGYLLKDRIADIAVLVDALRRIHDGETVIDPTIVTRLLGRRRVRDPLEELTRRERDVLASLPKGCPTARSPIGSTSPSARWKRMSLRSSSSSTWRTSRNRIAGCGPCWSICGGAEAPV